MLIDTHMHLSLNDNIEQILKDAKENNVSKFIISGCDDQSIDEAIDIIEKYDDIYAVIGYHPSEAGKVKDDDLANLEGLIKKNPKVVGLGEIGLDYYYGKDNREAQLDLFTKQLDIASRVNVPVVIHTRDAFYDTYNTLKRYNLTGVIHCFSGSVETASLYIKLGYLLGIGGVVTFKNSKLKDTVSALELQSIVLETDSPYLAPEPLRGTVNGPKNIVIIAEVIAKEKQISLEEVAVATSYNATQMFDLKI